MRIGIVGSGIAGLTAGWLFKQGGANVTIFEKHSRIGMDAHRFDHSLENESGEFGTAPQRNSVYGAGADIPSRMFNQAQWPNLSRLYQRIGVETQQVNTGKTFGDLSNDKAWLKLSKSFQPKLSPNLLLNRSVRQVLADISRMHVEVPKHLAESELDSTSMREYLAGNRYSEPFIRQFLYPALSATVCTCSFESLDAYPARTLLGAMLNLTKPEGLRRSKFGTRDVVERLTRSVDDIRFEASVESVSRNEESVLVGLEGMSEEREFDHLIVATQANAAARLFSDGRASEIDVLNQFKYENVSVVLHSDERLMPRRKKDWAQFNYLSDASRESSMCSIWMNLFYPEQDWGGDLFQTIMPICTVDPAKVISSISLQRPVVDWQSLAATKQIKEFHSQPDRRIWFCGSYASEGVPLLESGVVSSLNVAERLGFGWPESSPLCHA